MSERICCACRKESASGVVSFPWLSTGYPVGPACHGAWRAEALSLREVINNVAKVHIAFQRWLDTRKAAA